jgi:hypothetical protein
MPRSVLPILLALIALIPPAMPVESAPSRTEGCRRFVQGFYDWYVQEMKRDIGRGSELAIKRRGASFTRELRQRLAEDAAASAKSPDEIVGLDFDPILNAQDIAQRYTVRKVTLKGGVYRAEVYATWNGKAEKLPAVAPEVILTGRRWTFRNFRYPPHQQGEKESDLLTILKQLRQERAKPKR